MAGGAEDEHIEETIRGPATEEVSATFRDMVEGFINKNVEAHRSLGFQRSYPVERCHSHGPRAAASWSAQTAP